MPEKVLMRPRSTLQNLKKSGDYKVQIDYSAYLCLDNSQKRQFTLKSNTVSFNKCSEM